MLSLIRLPWQIYLAILGMGLVLFVLMPLAYAPTPESSPVPTAIPPNAPQANQPIASVVDDTLIPRTTSTPVPLLGYYTPTPASSPVLTATSTMTPTPMPINVALSELLEEYEQNKVRASARLRYQQNGNIPVSTSGYVSEVDELYVTIAPAPEAAWHNEKVHCHYADVRAAYHVEKGQLISVTGRVSGESQYYSSDLDMFHCEIEGIDLDNNPAISALALRANTVQVICVISQSRTQASGYAGTGVILDAEKGTILTVHHVVVDEDERKDCENLQVKIQGQQKPIPATIIKHCASIDRARIRISPSALSSRTLQPIYRAAAPAQVDQEIYFWGYGGGESVLRMETGVVQRISRDDITADAYAIPGDSGAPVYNEYGHLLGTMSRSNVSDRAVFTGDLCGEEATPTHIPVASTLTSEHTATPTPENAAATPTITSTSTNISTPQVDTTSTATVAPTATPTATLTPSPTPTSTPTPIPVGASRDNPILLGQSGTTHDGFEVQIVEVQKDAHEIVAQANESKDYYEGPPDGHVHIIVRIKVRNLSSEPQKLDKWNRLSVVGPSQLEFRQCHTPRAQVTIRMKCPTSTMMTV